MDLHKFDSTLKSALDNLEVPFDTNSWATLESRLDALPSPDVLDKVLRPSLERIETGYDAGTWSALANRMDFMARVRRVRAIKMAEAAILLLLLLNLKGFFGLVESVTNPVPAQPGLQEPIAQSRPKKSKNLSSASHPDQLSFEKDGQNLVEQMAAMVVNITAAFAQNAEIDELNNVPEPTSPIVDQHSMLDAAFFYNQPGLLDFAALPNRPLDAVPFAHSGFQLPAFSSPHTAGTSNFYIASYGALDQNYLRQDAYSDKQVAYAAGLAIGYRKGKWGVETGLQYSKKAYQPKTDNVTYQNDLTGVSFYHIDRVDADVLSVPVKVARQVLKIGKTEALAVAGLTAHLAAGKTYGYTTTHHPPVQGSDPSGPVAPLPNAQGVLENGGAAYNAYATADLGLRVEQPLGKRYTAFVEPVYRQSLGGGLGPNPARLSTFSFQAGVLASL